MTTQAIVLAGGLGTRLRSVVAELPKSMAPINGRPFLEYLLDDLVEQGITDIFLSVGYKHEAISGHFGNRYKTATITYVVESEPLGTGGGIRLALEHTSERHVFALNGDTIFSVNLTAMMQFHLLQEAAFSMALKPMTNFDRYGTVTTDDEDRINGFEEKQFRKQGLINGGVYLIDRSYFLGIDFPEKFSLEKEFFEKFYHQDPLYGFVTERYFRDIGIPEDYQKAQDEFARLAR